jgi:murein DD-endopeptidase MepM/ murein hydrolase activator NlpD
MKRKWFIVLLGVGLVVAIAFGTQIPRETDLPTPTNDNLPQETLTPSATATLPEISTDIPQTTEATLLPGETPAPFRFVFPTQAAAPVSAWRPPLYPVPWAPTEHDHFYFVRPIAADEKNWPDPNYRYGGVFFEGVTHTGVDIPAKLGATVMAAGPGKVIWAGYGLYSGPESPNDPYGLAVVIRHDFGYKGETLFTLYAHLSRVDVVRGQYVATGDLLGLVGETGFTTGPHLHFEVRIGENFLYRSSNPELWIAPPQGWGVLVARIMGSGGQLLERQSFTIRNLDTGQSWGGLTYGSTVDVNEDAYYRENVVVGDLPGGKYVIEIPYLGALWNWNIYIIPGQVNYFQFRGRFGFFSEVPPTPGPSPTPTPKP